MKNLLAVLQTQWRARPPNERRALRVLAVTLALALLGQLLWNLQQSRQNLRRQLPALATAAENMGQQVEAWRALTAAGRQALPALSQEEVNRRLAGLDGPLKISWAWPEQLHVSGQVAFDAWIEGIAELQRDYRLTVVRLQAEPAGAGRVKLEADLARPAPP